MLCVWLCRCEAGEVPLPAGELSLDAYRIQIARAQELLHAAQTALTTTDNNDTPWRVEKVLSPAAQEELRRLLPERTPVAMPTGMVIVNNQTLRAGLEALCASQDPAAMGVHLRYLTTQLDIVQAHLSAALNAEPADIQAILAREAFQPLKNTKTPLQYLQEWLIKLIDKIFDKLRLRRPSLSDPTANPWAQWWVQFGLWFVLALLFGWVSVEVVRRVRRRPAVEADGVRIMFSEPVTPDLDAATLLAQAQAAAAANDWRQAVRKVYLALLLDLDKRNTVSLNPAWTNREYLEAVRTQPALYSAMRELTNCFDVLWYGQHPGDRESYEQCLSYYHAAQAVVSQAIVSPADT